MKRERIEYDLAYGCYLFCGLAALLVSILFTIPGKQHIEFALFGVILLLWLVPTVLIAFVIGLIVCIRVWAHWPLVILLGLSVLVVALLFTAGSDTYTSSSALFIYGVVTIVMSGVWFFGSQRRSTASVTTESPGQGFHVRKPLNIKHVLVALAVLAVGLAAIRSGGQRAISPATPTARAVKQHLEVPTKPPASPTAVTGSTPGVSGSDAASDALSGGMGGGNRP